MAAMTQIGRARRRLDDRFGPCRRLDAAAGELVAQLRIGGGVGDNGELGADPARDRGQSAGIPCRRDGLTR